MKIGRKKREYERARQAIQGERIYSLAQPEMLP